MLVDDGGSVTIRFEHDRDGLIYGSGLEIQRVRAYRFRAESHCMVWHIEAYDTVTEIEGSEWVAELAAAEPEETGGSSRCIIICCIWTAQVATRSSANQLLGFK